MAKPKFKIKHTITKKEWDKTHKDFKSIIDGVHYVMKLTDKGTALVPVNIDESINEVEMGDMGFVKKHDSIATVYGVMNGGKKVKVKLGKTGKVVVIDTKDIQILPESVDENFAVHMAVAKGIQNAKVKNPQTKKDVKATTALKDKNHPAHKQAKSLLQRLKDKFSKKEGVEEAMVKPRSGHTYYQLTKDFPIKYIKGKEGMGLEVPGVLIKNIDGYIDGKKGAYLIDYFGAMFYVDMKKKFAAPVYSLRDQDKFKRGSIEQVDMAPEHSDWKRYIKESVNEAKKLKKVKTDKYGNHLEPQFKKGDKVTYLGNKGVITGVNKESSGVYSYNVDYYKGNGRTKARNIFNKSGDELKLESINEWKLQLDLGKVNPSEFENWASDSLQKKHKIKVSGSGRNWTIVGKGNDDRMGSSADWISQLLGKAWTNNKIKVVQKESVSEGKEPEIITQLRDVVKNGYKTLKDPKSGKRMKVDTYSASAIVGVYDKLNPSNQEKFVKQGLLGMQSLAFKFIK